MTKTEVSKLSVDDLAVTLHVTLSGERLRAIRTGIGFLARVRASVVDDVGGHGRAVTAGAANQEAPPPLPVPHEPLQDLDEAVLPQRNVFQLCQR